MPATAAESQPELLKLMRSGALPAALQNQANTSRLNGLLDGQIAPAIAGADPQGEVYRELVLATCRCYHQLLPTLFEGLDDASELLLPDDLLSDGSIAGGFRSQISDDDCEDVEIIGWLYQFYISENKDQVIGKVVKSENIPAATQLFTPNWIVKYMVQNSLGAQWLATYPSSALKGQMEYYIEPAEQTDEVKAQLAAITPEALNPEELTLIDKRESEADTCQAVEQTFAELELILRKIASLKGSQAVITADHGFLFQQEPVDANDRAQFPAAQALTFKNRRFALGSGIQASAGQKLFTAAELGLSGSWEAIFPLGLDRFPHSGAGSRFVHGGTSLQEVVVVPVIRLKRERKDESRVVEAELLRLPAKITTGKLSFGLYQLEPVEPRKRLPLQLRIGLYAKADGALLCAHRTLLLDSAASEAREREQQVILVLSNAAENYNNKILELPNLLAKAGKPWARLVPLEPQAPQRIPGRLRQQGPLSDPNFLLQPLAPNELADWDSSPLLAGPSTQ